MAPMTRRAALYPACSSAGGSGTKVPHAATPKTINAAAIRRACIASNENKISDAYRRRALIGGGVV